MSELGLVSTEGVAFALSSVSSKTFNIKGI